MLAARYGHDKMIALLLTRLLAKDVCAKDFKGNTSLILAAGHGHAAVTVELLKRLTHEDIEAANNSGTTALMNACRNGHSSTLLLILRGSGSDRLSYVLNAKDNRGRTALHMAAQATSPNLQLTWPCLFLFRRALTSDSMLPPSDSRRATLRQ